MGGLAFEPPCGRCAACLAQLVSEGAACHACGFGAPVPDFAREARQRMLETGVSPLVKHDGRWRLLADVVGK